MMERPLTVVQLLPELDVGGVERGTIEIAQALIAAGHHAIVVAKPGRLSSELTDLGATLVPWPIGEKRVSSLRYVSQLRALFATEAVDIVHARSRLPAWLGWLALRKMPRSSRPRWVTTVHGPYSVNRYSRIMCSGERVIAISNFIADYINSHYPQSSPRVTVIPRGVDRRLYPYDFEPSARWLKRWREQHTRLAQKKLITIPGRLTRWKGHEDFLTIIALARQQQPAIHGLVAGGPHPGKKEFENELHRKVEALGLQDSVSFLGARDDLRELLKISSAAVSITAEPEAFGRTTIEALSLGTPVIGYDHGGTGEILRDIFPYGLVEVGNVQAATDKLLAIEKAPAPAATHPFTVAAMQAATLAVYEELSGDSQREKS